MACIFYSNAYRTELRACLSYALCKHKTHSKAMKNSIKFQCYIHRPCNSTVNTVCERHSRHFVHCEVGVAAAAADEEDYKSWYWNGSTSHICAAILDSLYEKSNLMNSSVRFPLRLSLALPFRWRKRNHILWRQYIKFIVLSLFVDAIQESKIQNFSNVEQHVCEWIYSFFTVSARHGLFSTGRTFK